MTGHATTLRKLRAISSFVPPPSLFTASSLSVSVHLLSHPPHRPDPHFLETSDHYFSHCEDSPKNQNHFDQQPELVNFRNTPVLPKTTKRRRSRRSRRRRDECTPSAKPSRPPVPATLSSSSSSSSKSSSNRRAAVQPFSHLLPCPSHRHRPSRACARAPCGRATQSARGCGDRV